LPVVAVWQLIVIFADSACVFSITRHHDNRRGFFLANIAPSFSGKRAAATLTVTGVNLIIISISLVPTGASLTVVARCCSS
jgi:hypothetical protein